MSKADTITVNGTPFHGPNLRKLSLKEAKELFGPARVSDETVEEAWRIANPGKTRKKKAAPTEAKEEPEESSTND